MRGDPPSPPQCTRPYLLSASLDGSPSETCTSIIRGVFRGNATAFFSLNPGLYCDRLFTQTSGDGSDTSVGAPLDQVENGSLTTTLKN